jgi:hypothetical protein
MFSISEEASAPVYSQTVTDLATNKTIVKYNVIYEGRSLEIIRQNHTHLRTLNYSAGDMTLARMLNRTL